MKAPKKFLTIAKLLLISFLFLCAQVHAAGISSIRTSQAQGSTRFVLEHDGSVKSTHSLLKNPLRFVIDLEKAQLNSVLKNIATKIPENDPYISKVRVAQSKPNVVRIVFELKTAIKPQFLSLKADNKQPHRLVYDLSPQNAPDIDPITQLIQTSEEAKAPVVISKPKEVAPEESTPTVSTGPALKLSRRVTIIIDPGHGGADPGAIGYRGSKEKDVVLSISRKLKALLDQEKNIKVVLTRNADIFIPLHERVLIAQKNQGDLFISVHADAFIEKSANGSSVFALSEKGASSTSARWLAKEQNAVDEIGGIKVKSERKDVQSVLMDLSMSAQINDSLKFGTAVLNEIGKINRLHKSFVEQAGFAVLKAPDIPSILVETAFISNPQEEIKLNDPTHQQSLAAAIAKGLKKYFRKNPPKVRN